MSGTGESHRSPKRRRLVKWVTGLVLFYTLFGFFIAPVIVRSVAVSQLKKQLGRDVAVAKVRINPFVLSVTIDGFVVNERDGTRFLAWNRVYANAQLWSSIAHLGLVLDEISIEQPYVHVVLNHDGTYNFSDLLAKFATPAAAPVKPKKPDEPPPLIRVRQLRIAGGRADVADFSEAEPFKTTVGPITIGLQNFSTRPDNRNPYSFTATTESGETLKWRGHFYLDPIRSSGEFALENITLKKYAPFYARVLHLQIRDGTVDVSAGYEVELAPQHNIAYVTNAAVTVKSLRVAEIGATNDAIVIPAFTVADTLLDAVAMRAEVGRIETHGGIIRARVLPDHTINLLSMVAHPAGTNASPATTTATATAPATNTQNFVASVREIRIDDYDVNLAGALGEQSLTWSGIAISNVQVQTQPVLFSVDSITLTNAAFAHTDNSVQPAAAISVQQINARIAGIASDERTPTTVALTCEVNGKDPVEVTGEIHPFTLSGGNVAVSMKTMSLLPTDPYFGKFVGYRLAQGALTLDLNYRVDQRKLDAQNVIIIDQLDLGDATGSPDAVKLPVKLGLAILKDRNGVIKLDVPITGSFDDPKFHIRHAVMQTLANLFVKILTSPFNALGSMFGGGGEDLSQLTFADGTAQLAGTEARKLDILIKALHERPALHLEIAGAFDKEKDLDGLKHAKFEQQLRALKAKRLGSKAPPLDQITLTPEERVAYVRDAYLDALPQIAAKEMPASAATGFSNVQQLVPTGKPRSVRVAVTDQSVLERFRKAAHQLKPEQMEAKLVELTEVTGDDYAALAGKRASIAQEYILKSAQVEKERVAVAAGTTKTGCRVYFDLK